MTTGGTSSTRASSPSTSGTEKRAARRQVDPQRFLASLPLFEALDAGTLARLAAATQRRPLAKGERLFRRGDTPTGMYMVVFGEIRLLAHSAARGERLTGVVGPGGSFGEPVMFLERPALVDAQAATDALVLHVPKEAVFAEIDRDPLFARRLIAALSRKVESLVQEREKQAAGTGRDRLADYLLARGGGEPGSVISLPASKAALASLLNLTPEHFSRLLHDMAAAGTLRVEGRRITVLQPARLAVARPRTRGQPSPQPSPKGRGSKASQPRKSL
jgi:CRP/FNR family transcriptional regulator, dissimilatory nitrate respiration regulator